MANKKKDSVVEVKKKEALLYRSYDENKKGNPMLQKSGSKATKGDQFVIAGAKVIRADGGRKVQFIGNLKDPLYVDKEDVSNVKNGVTVHTVKKDDTLSKIAKKYYKKSNKELTTKIFQANRHLIEDPKHIEPKQKLIIPKK